MNIENILNLLKELKRHIFNNENKFIRFLTAIILSVWLFYFLVKISFWLMLLLKDISINISQNWIKVLNFNISYDLLVYIIVSLLIFLFLIIFLLVFWPDLFFNKKYKNKCIFFIDDEVSTDPNNDKTLSVTKEKIGKNILTLFDKYDFIVSLRKFKKLNPNLIFLKEDIVYIVGKSKKWIDSIYKNSPYNFYIKINVKNWNNFYPQIIFKNDFTQKEVYLRKKPLIRTDYWFSVKYLNKILEDDFEYILDKKINLYYLLQDYICYFNNISLLLNVVTNEKILDNLKIEEISKSFFNILRFRNFVFNTENKKLIDIYYCFNVFFFLKDLFKYRKEVALYHLCIKENFQSIFILYKNIETNFDIFFKLIKKYRQLQIIFSWIFANFAFIINELLKENYIVYKFKMSPYDMEDYVNNFVNIIPEILLNSLWWYYNRYIVKEFLLKDNKLLDDITKTKIANIFLNKFKTKKELYDKFLSNNNYMLETAEQFRYFIEKYWNN